MNPLLITFAHVEAINSRDLERISKLMSAKHVFIDSDASEVRDRQKILDGWKAYFAQVPDYRIEIKESFIRDNNVVVLGRASGTFIKNGKLDPENAWSVPAAWRAVIEGNQVAIWQVYVNPEPMVKILEKLGENEIQPIASTEP